MPALAKLARRDAAVAALILSLAGQPVQATEVDPVAAGRTLVTLDGEASKLAQVVELYRDSAVRCLRHQRWMIGEIAALPAPKADAGEPAEGKSPAREALFDPVGLRQARLDLYMVSDPRDAAEEVLKGEKPPSSEQAEIDRHLALRRACIVWSDRSLTLLKAAMHGGGSGMEARIAKAREAASRDEKRIKAVEAQKRPLTAPDMAQMETNAPAPGF